jgi:hypothetical protein
MHAIYKFIMLHEEIIGLLSLAFVVTMRPTLPAPFDKVAIFAWFYSWLHDAMLTFVNFRSPPNNNQPSIPAVTTGKLPE